MDDTNNNIIRVRWESSFFAKRAVDSRDRHQYEKALANFRRAFELDPSDAITCCNMAGVLAEIGDFEQSTSLLQLILEELNPAMTECYFYMANNYANMGLWQEAEQALISYLEQDESGVYLEDSEVLMDLIQEEIDEPAEIRTVKAQAAFFEHEKARSLLEEGNFTDALNVLESIIKMDPTFTAARNNIALAYYYTGQVDKAMKATNHLLADDPGNIHAMCNKAILLQHAGDADSLEQLQPLIETLRKTIPFHVEHVFKLATTMGILHHHQEAYSHFYRLLKDPIYRDDASLHHYIAVAAMALGKPEEARKHWSIAHKLDPESPVAQFYLEQLRTDAQTLLSMRLNYHYQLPFEEHFLRWMNEKADLRKKLQEDPLVRSSFYWVLAHGQRLVKFGVLEALELIADDDVLSMLRTYLMRPDEESLLCELAVMILRQNGVREPLQYRHEGTVRTLPAHEYIHQLPQWLSSWQEVVDLVLTRMRHSTSLLVRHEALSIFQRYLLAAGESVGQLKSPNKFAAALEYTTRRKSDHAPTYEQLAEAYGISITSISQTVKLLMPHHQKL